MAYQPKSYKKFVATAATATLVATAVVPAAFADEAVTAAFTDVPASYADAVAFQIENNFSVGLSPTQYGINAQITRGDAAIIIASAAGLMDETAAGSGFTDVPKRGAIAVNSLKKLGVVNGTSATKFGFDQPIKRGDAAIMFAKAFDLTEGSATDVKFSDVPDRYKEAVAALLANNVTKGINATQFGTDNNIKRGDFAKFVYALKDKIELDAPTNVASVTAANGVITVKFSSAPETTPTAADFKVSRTINSGATVEQSPTVTYDAATMTATLAVPTVAQADVAQTVNYTVQYKETAPKTASFNIAAPTQAAAVVTAGSEDDTVYVYFNAAVDTVTGTDVGNYRVDTNTGATTDAIVTPDEVTLNTTAVGPYGAGQVATLTFPDGTITNTVGSVRVANVKSNNVVIPTTTISYGTGVTAADATAPALSNTTLTNGISTPAVALSAIAGTEVTVQTTATDAANFVAGGQFRVLNSAGTEVKGWSSLNATNAPFDNAVEGLTGKFSTTGLAIGTYTVQFRATDAARNTSLVTAANATATLTILPANADVTAPTAAAITTTNYSNVAITGANAQGARTVRVTGLATDTTNLAAAPAGVAKVEYRVRQYNTATGTYTNGTWTNANASDGSFGGTPEAFDFVTPALNIGASYIIETRVTDNAGNVSAVAAVDSGVTNITGTTNTATTPGLAAPLEGTFTIANDTVAPTAGTLAVASGFALGTAAAPSRDRNVVLTATANDATVVSSVEFAVFKDNGTGVRELVREFSSAGVTATDGAFNSGAEAYSINYTLPETSGTYVIEAVAIDAAGNRSAIAAGNSVTHVLDVTPPTATIVPNTATTEDKYDFVVTFSEAIAGGVQVTDFEVRNALGQTTDLGLLTVASNIAPTGTANQYIVNVEGANQSFITAGNTLNVVGSTTLDLAGNQASGSYTIKASDLE